MRLFPMLQLVFRGTPSQPWTRLVHTPPAGLSEPRAASVVSAS